MVLLSKDYKSPQIATNRHKSTQVGTSRHKSAQVSTSRHKSAQVGTGRHRSAQVNSTEYEYAYDNIGNREFGKASMYEANALNQYTSIQENEDTSFVPTFDADGNQTLVKTDTGIWSVVYNAENCPVCFTNADGSTVSTQPKYREIQK